MTPLEKVGELEPEELQRRGTTTPVRVASRPAFTDAMFVTADNLAEVAKWCKGTVYEADEYGPAVVKMTTVDGNIVDAHIGSWVLLDVRGYPYPCDAGIFDARWRKA